MGLVPSLCISVSINDIPDLLAEILVLCMYIVDVAVPRSQAVLARPYSDKVGIIDMPFNSQNTIMNCDHIYCYPKNICEKCQVFIMSAYISWVFCVLQLRVDQVHPLYYTGTDPPTTVKQHLKISFRK